MPTFEVTHILNILHAGLSDSEEFNIQTAYFNMPHELQMEFESKGHTQELRYTGSDIGMEDRKLIHVMVIGNEGFSVVSIKQHSFRKLDPRSRTTKPTITSTKQNYDVLHASGVYKQLNIPPTDCSGIVKIIEKFIATKE